MTDEIIKDRDTIPILKEMGWKPKRDESGDYYCIIDQQDNRVLILPTIQRIGDRFRIFMMPSISTKSFNSIVEKIDGEKTDHEPIISSDLPDEEIPHVVRDDIVRLANEALAWASAQDVEAGLSAYRNLPTNAKGALPLRHLAALALAGDVERLHYYKECFERGDRLDFVLYVTTEMIDRALTLAKEERKKIDNMTGQV